MATSPVPPPQTQGPGPGGGFASPAPAEENGQAAQLLKMSLQIVSASRMIAQMVPQATAEVRQINDLVSKIQAKMKQNSAPSEPQAPPV